MQQIRPVTTIRVYDGEGAGSRSVLSTVESLRNTISPQVQVAHLGPEELLAGVWQDGCLMLVMPGGADLPYCRQLNGRGNCLIREYVEAGNAYLGLCAGAYYACSFVEFALGTRLEVRGPRELAFFPGVAAGPVYPGFRYESEAGAHAARVTFRPPQKLSPNIISYTSQQRSAADRSPPADRGTLPTGEPLAASTGNTTEGTPPATPSAIRDWEQVEPWAAVAGSASETASAQDWHQGVLPSSESTLPPGWITCRDYTNGGPQFVPNADHADRSGLESMDPFSRGGCVEHSEGSPSWPAYEVLAVYPDKQNGLASVKCNIGAGVAVLVGTHPELDTKWLLAEPERVPAVEEALKPHSASAPQSSSNDGDRMQKSAREGECERVQSDREDAGLKAGGLGVSDVRGWVSDGSVREQLERSRAERRMFWIMLLQSAGLGSYILDTAQC
ncbi:probable biotin-protein ligase at N-terminal half [Coccomyxa sp. Obi]|nr:probable biotin-protein ligase at N-terminal half [Coccomyxa sp. Obi]